MLVLGWGGMRGVVSLEAAPALPLGTDAGVLFPNRAAIIFLTFAVILGTLVVQGLTLPALIRHLGVRGDDAEACEDVLARRAAAGAALEHVEQLEARADEESAELLAGLRQR